MLRSVSSLLLVILIGCGPSFYSVQQVDTIEAYEEYLANGSPSRSQRDMATQRLEFLYLEQAKNLATLEAYDAFLARYPEGEFHAEALAERETSLFEHAVQQDDPATWQTFLDEYPKTTRDRERRAQKAIAISGYRQHLHISEPVVAEVNLAEDPKGPMNGMGFRADVTNNGDKTLTSLALTMSYLDKDGVPVATKEWSVVRANWGVPMPEEATTPMKPGDTRTWSWSELKEGLPKSFGGTVSLRASSAVFAKE